jgi:tetratricopeptide (TPR) repeat protein
VIDPDEDPGPSLDPPPEPPEPPGERLQRQVAVLIMVVTLLGAVFAYLQTTASARAARATRQADTAGVEAMARLAAAGDRIAAESRLWSLAYEDALIAVSLAASGNDQARSLVAAYNAARTALLPYTDLALPGYQKPDGTVDWSGFVEEALAPSYRYAELQKAHGAERDGWGAKGGALVAVITVLAVALFLLGLSRTPVAAASGTLLIGAGSALAVVAAVWGLAVFARSVAAPSAEAIDAYVEGRVAFNSVVWETDAALIQERLGRAEEAFGRAIELRPGYVDAFLGRGTTRFRLDLLQAGGPTGSEGARDDFTRAVSLSPLDAVAWGDLGAARFWLGDLEGAGSATRRALELDPGDLVFNLNLALFLALEDGGAAYEAQWERVIALAGSDDMPAWVRTYTFARLGEVFDLAAARFPEYAAALDPLGERARRLDHQIGVSKRFYGTATPPAVAVTAAPPIFSLSEDRTRLVAVFAVSGATSGQSWLWRTYRGGLDDPTLSSGPQGWSFGVPDEPELNITLDLPGGFPAGTPVRVELFFEGNLIAAGEFTP